MKTLCIIGYHRLTNDTMTALADQWYSYLHNVGCDIEIKARADAFIITWETNSPSVIHHILDFVEITFGDYYDISEVSEYIINLRDCRTVSFYADNGKSEVA